MAAGLTAVVTSRRNKREFFHKSQVTAFDQAMTMLNEAQEDRERLRAEVSELRDKIASQVAKWQEIAHAYEMRIQEYEKRIQKYELENSQLKARVRHLEAKLQTMQG